MSESTAVLDYDLTALLDLMKRDILISTNCHAIAIVQKFDPVKQVVEATMTYKKSFNTPPTFTSTGDKAASVFYKDYPVMLDMPAIILSGGAAHLELPISQGDECLILFNDRDIDNWFSSGQVTALNTSRMHNFSDGIALVGLRSLKKSITGWDLTRASLKHGTTRVGVSSSKVKIENANRTALPVLNGIIDKVGNLQSALSTFAGSLSSAIDPTVVSAAAALTASITSLNAALTTYKTGTIGDLFD